MEEVMSQLTKAPDKLTDKGRYRAARAAKKYVSSLQDLFELVSTVVEK